MTNSQIAALAASFAILAAFHVLFARWRRRLARESPSAPAARGKYQGLPALSLVGIALQFASFVTAFAFPRPAAWAEVAAGVALQAVGVALALAAMQAMGKQWSLVARAGEEHELVTSGPFALVRHPIYSAMLVVLAGVCLAWTRPLPAAAAAALYFAATRLRTAEEERLLLGRHGDGFRAWRDRTGWLLPRLRRRR